MRSFLHHLVFGITKLRSAERALFGANHGHSAAVVQLLCNSLGHFYQVLTILLIF